MMKKQIMKWICWGLCAAPLLSAADGLEIIFLKHLQEDAPATYSVEARVSFSQTLLGGVLTLPNGTNKVLTLDGADLVCSETVSNFTDLATSGWTTGDYAASFYLQAGPAGAVTKTISYGLNEYNFPWSSDIEFDGPGLYISTTPSFDAAYQRFWIEDMFGSEVFRKESALPMGYIDWSTITVSTNSALNYETDYTAYALIKDWQWQNQMTNEYAYLGTVSSLEFTTSFQDEDSDALPDSWEQQIIDDNTGDAISAIGDVSPRDDYDNDGFTNQEEYVGNLNPIIANTNVFNTFNEGMTLLDDMLQNESIHFAKSGLLQHCFEGAVASNPADYKARIFLCVARFLNLTNNDSLHNTLATFGATVNSLLVANMDKDNLDPLTFPQVDWTMDSVCSNLLPAIDASLADLAVIPVGWTNSVMISTNDFPLAEDIYIDEADVTFMRAALQMMAAQIRTAQAYQFNVNYDKVVTPVSAPMASITVDGQTNDWVGIEPQLIGAYDAGVKGSRAAYSSTNIYLLIEMGDSQASKPLQVSGKVMFGNDSQVTFNGNIPQGSSTNGETHFTGELETNGVFSCMRDGSVVEMAIPVPAGQTMSDIRLNDMHLSYYDYNNYYWWGVDDLGTPENVKFESLLNAHPTFGTVRSGALLSTAKSNLVDAVDFFLAANALTTNRTDALMHFVEYDPADETNRTEVIDRALEIQASLTAPVQITATNDLGETEFDERVYLGAFFAPNYLTRAMLPDYKDILSQPLAGTFPDPTMGGIFPDWTQASLTDLMAESNDDLDYDRLPNDWELMYSGSRTNMTAAGDGDNDGYSNLEEYICGSSPTNAASAGFFVEGSPTVSGGQYTLQWSGVDNRWYTIWWSPDLTEDFQIVAQRSWPPYQYAVPITSNGFFKVEVEMNRD